MGRRKVWQAAGLALLMLLSTLGNATAVAVETSHYNGPLQLGANSTMPDVVANSTSTGFSVPVNATLTDGWLNVSTNWEMDGGNGTWFELDVENHSLAGGIDEDTSTSHFGSALSLSPSSNVGYVDNLEDLQLQFNGYASQGWRVYDYSGLPAANGSIPTSIPEGLLIAATTESGGVKPGTSSVLVSDAWDLPQVINNLTFHMNDWLNVDSLDDAVVEATIDNTSWHTIDTFTGHEDVNWTSHSYLLDNLIPGIINASWIRFRFTLEITNNSQERPGWFIDALSLSNSGEPTNSWFHGNLNGAYAADADNAFVIETSTLGLINPLELEISLDWDMEGGGTDNLVIEGSLDNHSWTQITMPPGIPGTGVFHNGAWVNNESHGFLTLFLPALSGFANDSQVWFRFSVQTDSQNNGGGQISGWEGIYVDDFILHSQRGSANHTWRLVDNFTTSTSISPISMNNKSHQWQHVSNHGHNGPSNTTYGFEDSPRWPDGWNISIESGSRGWAFGDENSTYLPDPPSGDIVAGIEFGSRYRANMWTHLTTPSMYIQPGASARLVFKHWICTEANWDGGAVYLSTDGGSTWNHFGQNVSGFYETNSTTNPHSPFYMKGIFDGSTVGSGCMRNHPYTTEKADVSHLAGQEVMFRFSFFSDTYVEEWGWYIDDVGIEVDYFEPEGVWTSPSIEADDWGYGVLDVRGYIPPGTWVNGSVISTAGEVLIEESVMPINLSMINWSTYPELQVRVHLSTADQYISPIIEKVSIGADLYLNPGTESESFHSQDDVSEDTLVWNVDNSRYEVNGSTQSQAFAFIREHRPVSHYEVHCDCSDVSLWLDRGNVKLFSNPGSIVVDRDDGVGEITVMASVLASGWVRSLVIMSRYVGFSDNPSIDVGNDSMDEWAWPSRMQQIGHHGIQSYIAYADITSDNSTTREILDSQQASFELDNSTIALTVLVPTEAESMSFRFDWENQKMDGWSNSSYSVQYNQQQGVGVGSNGPGAIFGWYLDPSQSRINLTPLQELEFTEFKAIFNNTGKWRLDIHRMMFTYKLAENISIDLAEISSGMEQWSVEQNSSVVDVPITFNASRGGISLDGAIEWQHLIQNDIVASPEAMVPDGTRYTVSTTHLHLYNESFTSYDLRMSPTRDPMDAEVLLSLQNPHSPTPTFYQPDGQGLVDWDMGNTTLQWVDNHWRIDWVFSTRWLWDDRPYIHFMAEAHDSGGTALGPAVETIGQVVGNAVENDLELIEVRVEDQHARLISDTLDYNHPWPVEAGSELFIEGRMRFQGSVDSWIPSDAAEVHLSMNDTQAGVVALGGNGTWAHTITTPVESGLMELEAHAVFIGDEGESEDVSTGVVGTQFIIDDSGPLLGTLMALTQAGDQPADGHVWDRELPLALGIRIEDVNALGDELILNYWRSAFDDDDDDGIADELEYRQIAVALSSGSTEDIEFPFIDVDSSFASSEVSIYLTSRDLAGLHVVEGGGFGLADDLATLRVMLDDETTIDHLGIEHDSLIYPGKEHTFSFDVDDDNGVSSLDVIHIELAGESGDCSIELEPWSGEVRYDACFLSRPSFRIVDSTVSVDYILAWESISILGSSEHTPSLRVEDKGEDLGLGLTNLHWLNWSLANGIEIGLTVFEDLVPENGSFVDDTLYLQPGDIIDVEWSVFHLGTEMRVEHLPEGSLSTIEVLGGLTVMKKEADLSGNGSGLTRFIFEQSDIPNGKANIVADISGLEGYDIREMDVKVILDDDMPRIEFSQSSLTRIRSDSSEGLQVSFKVEDDAGVPAEDMILYWSFTRNGYSITGAEGSLEVDYVSDGIYYDVLNISLDGLYLKGSDEIMIWVEGRDLAGNPLIGPGSAYEPRRPAWDYISFSPEVVHISVSPRIPRLGELIDIDVQLQNTGSLSGNTSISLLQQVDDEMVLLEQSDEIRLLSGLSLTQSFSHEVAIMGDQQLYLQIDNSSDYIPVPLGIVRENLVDDTSSGIANVATFGFLGIFILIVVGMFLLRSRHEDDWEEVEEELPPPPPPPRAEVPPPRPVELDALVEEE